MYLSAPKGNCSHYENDSKRFAHIIADNYLSTEFDHMPGLVRDTGISCWASQPNGKVDTCYLRYSDGISVGVRLNHMPDYVSARALDPEKKPLCSYSYDCTDKGMLVFTKIGCSP